MTEETAPNRKLVSEWSDVVIKRQNGANKIKDDADGGVAADLKSISVVLTRSNESDSDF